MLQVSNRVDLYLIMVCGNAVRVTHIIRDCFVLHILRSKKDRSNLQNNWGNNLSKEQLFSKSEILLSTTDLDSRIKYANKNFCDIAGYSLDEMLAQPHNMVRHKDMPKAAFADLWSYIQSGKSWMGPVKNRCKNGDYYWGKRICHTNQR